ncbi:MAG: hypothetical protein ACT4TC_25970 [Myxococcaceae bacterium]
MRRHLLTFWLLSAASLSFLSCNRSDPSPCSPACAARESCLGGRCAGPTCGDRLKNGDETDVDCGGSRCPACLEGKACTDGTDCYSALCESSVCLGQSCGDTVKNGNETDVDCGGLICLGCGDGKLCREHRDCLQGRCAGNVCVRPTCSDGLRNGDETDADCGGSCAAKCVTGKGCLHARDCVTASCEDRVCKVPSMTCADRIKNGSESDVDCGGACASKCVVGRACGAGPDCATGVCTGLTCIAATCTDGVRNGNEAGVDCGGSCPNTCGHIVLLAGGGTGILAATFVPGTPWNATTLIGRSDGVAISGALGLVRQTSTDVGTEKLQYTRWNDGAWSALADVAPAVTTRALPAVSSGQVVFQGTDFKHYFAAFDGTAWNPSAQPVMSGGPETQSFGPVPATLAVSGTDATVVFINGDKANDLYAQDRNAGVFAAAVQIASGASFNVIPSLVRLNGARELMALSVRATDSAILWQTRTGVTWTDAAAVPNGLTVEPVALVALPQGDALLAYRGTNGVLYTSRFSNSSWTQPTALGTPFDGVNATLRGSPALSPGVGGALAELAFIGDDYRVYHARFFGTAWTTPQAVTSSALAGATSVSISSLP